MEPSQGERALIGGQEYIFWEMVANWSTPKQLSQFSQHGQNWPMSNCTNFEDNNSHFKSMIWLGFE